MTTYSDEWIVSRRGPRNPVDPKRPYHFLIEEERAASGEVASVATIFLTNRECPWRCLMCDLWKNTLRESVAPGDIPGQIEFALERLGGDASPYPKQVKLYNSGSFFDAAAIPPSDYPDIAKLLSGFERVIVECHPALVGRRIVEFRDMLRIAGRKTGVTKLEVAMGLETVHPEVLPRLNKRMKLEMFADAASFLYDHEIDLRAFVLLKPPFLSEEEGVQWAQRSVEFAFDCHATVVSIIPVRPGNGALEALDFAPPKLQSLEAALDNGIRLQRGRVFADLWELEQFSECKACFAARHERLARMNQSQVIEPPVPCAECPTTLT
jgi:radical SAM enzyme (TIGR01210 family)